MEWSEGFYDFFQITFNSISLKEDRVYRGYKLVISEDIQMEEELDDVDFNNYITSFGVMKPNGEIIPIKTSNTDNLYFEQSFYDYLMKVCPDTTKGAEETYYAELDMVELMNFPVLFIVEIKNNELSATMNKIEKLIDNKSVISMYDRNSILREFITTNIQGGIKLNAVHFETLLMNQMRNSEDELDMPDWTIPHETCQILTLSRSLSNNRSITVRLESNKTNKALNSPQNDKLFKPAVSDVFFMESPQEYLKPELISDENKPQSDVLHAAVEEPITFSNPKIRVGRARKKKVSQTGE